MLINGAKVVLRSLYLDEDTDADLASRAADEETTKAELIRRYITEGLARPATGFAEYTTPANTEKKQ